MHPVAGCTSQPGGAKALPSTGNCTDFAETLVESLGVEEPFPIWVHGVAKVVLKQTPLADTNMRLLNACGTDCLIAKVEGPG